MHTFTALAAAFRTLVWRRHKFLTVVSGLILLVVIVCGIVILNLNQSAGGTNAKHQTSPPAIAVVEITPSGFVPSTISVAANSEVVWVNEDVMPHLPAADPYPTHSSLPSLVAPRALGQKETYSFLFTKAATLHYHDDINPTLVGTVVVR